MTMARSNIDAPVGPSDVSDTGVIVDGRRYLRAPVPLRFPETELAPESKRHLKQRTTLFQILELAFADRAAIGCDQFVSWDPTDPTQCLAPDAFVRLGAADDLFKSWKVWERGAPEVAVEILSDSDARDRDWDEKLQRYRRLGVQELVRFDPECDPPSLRVWDAVDGDLVEREVTGRASRSRYLSGSWLIVADAVVGSLLRLSQDAEGTELYPTPAERAEARVRELEAELQRRNQ
jgi:Uma2 family endonuclease